ncbi:MAG: glutaminyl-tRNA synthase (glutamine-hydrolyzing) subunit B [Parcubacteria group bacterium RIFOXYD2_FULL_52_8]|nr:MAG: glutaminyl-tRNA synthase (glutamine-hydrolyzing) subunit B [Parcubacteria group bacterium RIFOXYD2_FULL_52_8]
MGYTTTIGLEIHAELKTATKMFCSSKNDPDEKRPNVNVCPICMAHPGTLPVINKEAVRHVLRVGHALGSTLADFTEFDRKNYFYPDLPKGYQISQYKYPLVAGGSLNGVMLTRIHLEEDAARNQHGAGGESLVDFNRAGVPLMELVTEPVIKSAEEAAAFARELQLLLRYLGASEANMEKGEMRVEANISVSPTEKFGTKVEVKNLNSFKVVEKAITFEVKRQIALLEKGELVAQETRGWDDAKQITFSQRAKANSHDYRYFPDPDLPKLKLSEVAEFAHLKKTLPELPWERRRRLKEQFGLKDLATEIFVTDHALGSFFEEVVIGHEQDKEFVQSAANYITSDLISLMKAEDPGADLGEDTIAEKLFALTPAEFGELIGMLTKGELSSRAGKDILTELFAVGGSPRAYAETHGLLQKNDEGELAKVIEETVRANEKVAAEVRAGKTAALQFLVGQAMKQTKGGANPAVLCSLFEKLLSS